MSSYFCLKCNRPLSDPKSIRHGYGPECWSKLQRKLGWDVFQVPEKVTIINQEVAKNVRIILHRRLIFGSRVKTCSCGTPIADCEMITSDQGEGGLPLKGYAVPQWVWFECPKCKYQTAWWKLGPHNLDDLAPPQGGA